ncbi:GNAT family N-acetyltransferase [Shewanella sp. NIFS-20-20]|uniref:GNAT family N-acetyltransferase n=1 Tax=Shewanella sp. NIFS-20-20 TaxID=2853806 RepID=UPI001C443AAB|nr:GNAT family N-acetyltransferase [Shewanella sp. NIFS-20-20]MBV7316079.1 GNAT family N-acetyltransferase [Shewanella sp. NIFS-20-20]
MLTTARMHLREFTLDDAPAFYALNLDPQVIKYTGDQPFASVDAATDFIAQYNHYQIFGFGRWALQLTSMTHMIGFCGLRQQLSGEVDLGVRLAQAYWGQGLAFEASMASLGLGFGRYELTHIKANCHRDNLRSQALITKLGFNLVDDRHGWWQYCMDSCEFRGDRY